MKENNMGELISVIIPCFNVERYIDRCMESVLNQTYQDLEIILVDDGSTDGTGKIIKKYAKQDRRIKILYQDNKGAGAARNAGLEIVEGAYIGFVDGDDWIEPDMYEYLKKLMDEGEADIAACDYISIDKYYYKKDNGQECIQTLDRSALMEKFFRIHGEKSCYSVCNMLYKKEIVNGCKFPEGGITEDLLFNYKVYCNCNKYICSNIKKYYYFFNVNGVTRKELSKKDWVLLYNWDFIVEETKINNTIMLEYALMNRWRADFTLLSKALLYGYDKNEISEEKLMELIIQVRKHQKYLIQSRMLDWKRKFLVILVCCRYCFRL